MLMSTYKLRPSQRNVKTTCFVAGLFSEPAFALPDCVQLLSNTREFSDGALETKPVKDFICRAGP